MTSFIRTTLNPAMYHGHRVKPPFFEGWYFKLVDATEKSMFAIIPGIIHGEDAHAFIQVLDGVSGSTAYHRYKMEEFQAAKKGFHIRIGENEFTQDRISLRIKRSEIRNPSGIMDLTHRVDLYNIEGALQFSGVTPWPVTVTSPGIMGWYAWVPFMECYHGVVSLDHTIAGTLRFGEQPIEFTKGRGYIEKDWGQSFPDAWIWSQSNHFHNPGTSLTASVATIPWLGSSFRGFIIGLWHNQVLYRFATYNRARVESLDIQPDQVNWVISNSQFRLTLRARRVEGGLLKGPTRLEMDKRVVETLNASIEVRLETRSGKILFSDTGRHAGLEVHNSTSLLPVPQN